MSIDMCLSLSSDTLFRRAWAGGGGFREKLLLYAAAASVRVENCPAEGDLAGPPKSLANPHPTNQQ